MAAICISPGGNEKYAQTCVVKLLTRPDKSAGEFRGAIQAVKSISQAEGFRGLFAGYGSFLLRDLPFDAIEFVAYEQLKRSYKASLTEVRDPNSLETSAIGKLFPPASMHSSKHCSSGKANFEHDQEALMPPNEPACQQKRIPAIKSPLIEGQDCDFCCKPQCNSGGTYGIWHSFRKHFKMV